MNYFITYQHLAKMIHGNDINVKKLLIQTNLMCTVLVVLNKAWFDLVISTAFIGFILFHCKIKHKIEHIYFYFDRGRLLGSALTEKGTT